jgi:hypothetical protein
MLQTYLSMTTEQAYEQMTPEQQLEYVAQWEAWQQYYQYQQQVREFRFVFFHSGSSDRGAVQEGPAA